MFRPPWATIACCANEPILYREETVFIPWLHSILTQLALTYIRSKYLAIDKQPI